MSQIPNSFYVIVGVLVVANFSSLIALITFIYKAGMFVAETKAGIAKSQDTGNRAHKRIDKIEVTQ
jgi:hypothetical protein